MSSSSLSAPAARSAASHALSHILAQLQAHRARRPQAHAPPLFVAVQGPQGSGKTFLTSQLAAQLAAPPHALRIAVLSLDDLYLPHAGLHALAAAHPHSALLAGRGPPGTHDIPLGTRVLGALARANEPGAAALELPVFEKSLFGGEGDRLAQGVKVDGPLDVVVFEGWCVGFCPIDGVEVDRRYELPVPDIQDIFDLKTFRKEDIFQINANLWEYVEWWEFFDVFIQIKPPDSTPYALIYKWRLEQEHYMKARNGGKGMSDDQVKKFIDRYIPGYIFFADGIQDGYTAKDQTRKLPNWLGNALKITIDKNRNVLAVDAF